MNWILIIFALLSGAVMSLFYFGGLWLTLKKIAEYRLSYWLVLASFIIRLAFVLLVFYAMIIYHWSYLVISLVSFLAVRQLLVARLGKPEQALYG
jgi:F1F0 ATPase subunit 2